MKSSNFDHLTQDSIFRALDDELTSEERFQAELHLAVCEHCRTQLDSLRSFSLQIEAAVQSAPIPNSKSARTDLQKAIEKSMVPPAALQHPGKVLRRFGWSMAVAATLAIGILLAPRHQVNKAKSEPPPRISAVNSFQPASMIEVNGESFQTVPYSNADLPIAAPHIVQMQVPISSLADVGIVLEPVSTRAALDAGGSVLADVLVGPDGQPRGVHVLEVE